MDFLQLGQRAEIQTLFTDPVEEEGQRGVEPAFSRPGARFPPNVRLCRGASTVFHFPGLLQRGLTRFQMTIDVWIMRVGVNDR